MTFTREQLATLNTLMADHAAQEMLLMQLEQAVTVWAYSSDDGLMFTATVDDLGGIRIFEWLGALA